MHEYSECLKRVNMMNVEALTPPTTNMATHLPSNAEDGQFREMDNNPVNNITVEESNPKSIHISVLESGMMLVCRQ